MTEPRSVGMQPRHRRLAGTDTRARGRHAGVARRWIGATAGVLVIAGLAGGTAAVARVAGVDLPGETVLRARTGNLVSVTARGPATTPTGRQWARGEASRGNARPAAPAPAPATGTSATTSVPATPDPAATTDQASASPVASATTAASSAAPVAPMTASSAPPAAPAPPSAAAPTTSASPPSTASSASVSSPVPDQILALVNSERTKAGCGPLALNDALAAAAQAHAADMAANGYFDHNSQDGRSPFDRMTAAGYTYRTAGENIARGQKDAAAVMTAWMNSPGHKANIVNCSFKDLGVGYVGGSGGPWWVQDFGG